MKKTLLPALIIVLCVSFSYTTFAEPASQESQAIEENKVKYQQLDKKTIDLNSDITNLNVEIQVLDSKLKKNSEDIESTKQKISEINENIEKSKKEIDDREVLLGKRIRALYKSDLESNPIVFLISSESLTDMINRISIMDKVICLDKKILSDIKSKTESLNRDSEELENKQNYLNTLAASIQSDLEKVNIKKQEQQKLLNDLNAQKDAAMSIIESNEKNLISHPISTIDSSNSISSIKEAIDTLNSLIPQLNSPTAIDNAKSAISKGEEKVKALEAVPVTTHTINPDISRGDLIKLSGFTATAYTGGTITKMGLKPVRNPNGLSTIAVDPSVIPLGSKVFVEGYGYAIASDTGGAIKGNIIDLYMNSVEECNLFGRRPVNIHIVAGPSQW